MNNRDFVVFEPLITLSKNNCLANSYFSAKNFLLGSNYRFCENLFFDKSIKLEGGKLA
jgi:hypothetical protein